MSSMQNAEIQYKASAGTFNLDEAQGIVECFVAGIGNKDSVGDVCATGAFTKSLLRRKPRVVWGHNWNDPIGKVLDIYEVPASDSRLPMKMKMAGIGGLYAKVQFNLQSEKGREAFANVAFFGEEQEWSIGYKTLRAQYDQNMQANILHEVELYEVSPVLHGANQLTGTISVKNDSGKSETIERTVFASGPMQEAINVKPITSQENNAQDDLLQKISSELEKRTASKIKIISLDKNSVVFDRQTSDGLVSKYMCKYHYDGQELMFGQPQRIVVQKPNINPSMVPSQQGKPTMHGRVTKPVPVMPMPVAIKPGENGPISVPLPVVVYEDSSRNKPITPKPLDNEEQALADALVRITKKYGKFNEDKKGVYAAYTPAADNELINIGVKCSNCVFFKGEGSCRIIDKAVEADGRCRFAVIPPGVVGGSAIDKKEYNDFLDEEEVKWVEDIEEKYPGEFIFGVLRNVIKKRRRKRKKYKELNEFDAEEYAIKEKTLASEKEKFFYIPVDVENAFEVKSLLDTVLDHHRVDSFVDEYGIVLTSGLTDESVDAINIAVKGIGTRIGKRIGSGLINRPRIGDRKKKLGSGRIDIPTGGMRGTKKPTGNRRDVDGDGWADEGTTNPVWVGQRSGANVTPERKPKKLSSGTLGRRKLSSGAKTQIAENDEKIAELKEEIDRAFRLGSSPSGRGDAVFQNSLRQNLLDMSQELRLLEAKKKRLETESRRPSKKKNVEAPFPEAKPKRVSKQQRDDEKIYKRRNDGESLAEVAESLGLSREEVRKREQRHMRRLRKEEGERLSEDSNRSGEKLSSGLLPISEALRRSEPPDFTPEDKQKIMMRVRDTPEYQDLREIQEILDGYVARGRTRASMPDLDKREIAANRAVQDRRDYIIEQMIARGEITRPKRSEDSNRSGEKLSSGKTPPSPRAFVNSSNLSDEKLQITIKNAPKERLDLEINGKKVGRFPNNQSIDRFVQDVLKEIESRKPSEDSNRSGEKLSSGRKKKGKIAKRKPFSPEDRQRFADGDRLRARTIPSKKKPGPSVDEFRLSSGYNGGSRPARRLAQLNRREIEQIYVQESRGMEEAAKELLRNLKTPSLDESLEKGSKLDTIRGNLKKTFTTPALVGSLSDNKNRKKDGPWLLSFEKLRPLLRDSNGEQMSDENIKKMFNLNEDEMKKLLGKNGAISSASVQSYLTAHSPTGDIPGESDGLIRKIWGFDSAPYWYDGLEDNRAVSREDYDSAKDESTFLAAIYPLDAPIDFKTSTEMDEDVLPKKREIVVAEDVKRSIESVKGKESKEAYGLDKLIEKLNLPADSGKNREEIAKAFEKLLGVPTSAEQLFTRPNSWRRVGVPTNVVLELKKRKHITSAGDVFDSDEARNFDKATEQNKFFSALDNLLRANGIQIGGGKGNLSDRVIGEIMGDATGSTPLAKIGRAFKEAGENRPFTYKVGAAVVWTPEEIQKTLDGINKVTGKDFKVSDLKLSSGKFGKGERKITPKLSSGRTGAESFSANESINEIDERLRTAKKRGSKVFNEMLRAESKKQSSQKVKSNPLDKMKDGERLSSGKLDEVYKSITQKLIKAIETADGDKWEAPWYKVGAFPKNPTNKNRPYSNTNLLFLLMAQEDKGYTKPYWATYKQWEKSGGQVRAGEKGTKILVPRVYKAKEDADGNKKEGGVFYSVATVFNVDQVDGVNVEEMENKFPKLSEEQRVSQLESAIKEIGAKITETASDRAYYSPSKDEIVLPNFENFKSPLDFYATQAHELMHWTGHTSRLNRPNMNYFGSPEYAYEELVAEIASAFFMAAHGLSAEPQPQHAMYLASWLKRLKSDPDALQKAVSDAQKAVNFAIKLSPSMSKQMAVSENVDDVPGITVPEVGGKLSSGKAPELPALTRALKNAGLAESVTENMITEALGIWKDNPSLHKQYIERLDGDVNGAVFSLYNDYLEDMFDRSPEGVAKIERELNEQYEAERSLSSGRPSKRLSRRAKDNESSKLSSGKQPWDDSDVQKRLIDGARTKKKTKADGKTESFMASVVRQFDAGRKLSDNQWKPLWESFGGKTSGATPSTPSTAPASKTPKPFSGLKRKEIDLSEIKKYDYPTTDSKGKKKPPPTEEQSDAIDAMMTGSDVKIAALAATGKTTTVINFANRLLDQEPESRILYLVFNKNAKEDAIKRGMPDNVQVATMDEVAYQAMTVVNPAMTAKSFEPEIKPIIKTTDRAAYLGAKQIVSQGNEISASDVMRRVAKAVDHFAIGNDLEVGPQHFRGNFNGKLAVEDEAVLPELIALAKKYWKDVQTPRDGNVGMLPVTNNHITKMWALSNPDMGAARGTKADYFNNIAIVDEAQDMNPVFSGLLKNAKNMQRIYVGDTNQAINAWRGADGKTLIDASAKYTMPITDSFRFGKNIAGIGNRFLSLLGAKEKMNGRKTDKSGNPVDGFIGEIENPTMLLTRSNGGAMAATMKSFEKGLTVYGSKNFKNDDPELYFD